MYPAVASARHGLRDLSLVPSPGAVVADRHGRTVAAMVAILDDLRDLPLVPYPGTMVADRHGQTVAAMAAFPCQKSCTISAWTGVRGLFFPPRFA